jgi:hypothetical protein
MKIAIHGKKGPRHYDAVLLQSQRQGILYLEPSCARIWIADVVGLILIRQPFTTSKWSPPSQTEESSEVFIGCYQHSIEQFRSAANIMTTTVAVAL